MLALVKAIDIKSILEGNQELEYLSRCHIEVAPVNMHEIDSWVGLLQVMHNLAFFVRA